MRHCCKPGPSEHLQPSLDPKTTAPRAVHGSTEPSRHTEPRVFGLGSRWWRKKGEKDWKAAGTFAWFDWRRRKGPCSCTFCEQCEAHTSSHPLIRHSLASALLHGCVCREADWCWGQALVGKLQKKSLQDKLGPNTPNRSKLAPYSRMCTDRESVSDYMCPSGAKIRSGFTDSCPVH